MQKGRLEAPRAAQREDLHWEVQPEDRLERLPKDWQGGSQVHL